MIKTEKPIEEKDIVVNTKRLSNLGILDNETIKQANQLMKAHLNLAQYCLNQGYSITVHYGNGEGKEDCEYSCLLYTSPSPRDRTRSRMPSSA